MSQCTQHCTFWAKTTDPKNTTRCPDLKQGTIVCIVFLPINMMPCFVGRLATCTDHPQSRGTLLDPLFSFFIQEQKYFMRNILLDVRKIPAAI